MITRRHLRSDKRGFGMRGYDFASGREFEATLSGLGDESCFVLMCDPKDVCRLRKDTFDWDKSTVVLSTNLDETMRYTGYSDYDFVSMFHIGAECDRVEHSEINIYFAQKYLVLVLPECPDDIIERLLGDFHMAIEAAKGRPAPLSYLYHYLFEWIATDSSNTLERLEDEMEDASEALECMVDKKQSSDITELRKKAYTYRKLLRALSEMGEQILADDNNLLDEEALRYFRNTDRRLGRLYGFAGNLFEFSQELLRDYESKLSFQMNENVKTLTLITLFFGPLTVISGIYGMNFVHVPEFDWQFGFFFALGLMVLVSLIVFLILKKKRWF
ncbi:MAG TPA: hypothetical protein DEB24_05765 [Coriobacteriia bacterium]|nr:hypothetical protein [Coriobacteriia bacterium]